MSYPLTKPQEASRACAMPDTGRDGFGRRLSRLLRAFDHPVIPPAASAGAGNQAIAGSYGDPARPDAIKELDEATRSYEAWELQLYTLVHQTNRSAAPAWGTRIDEPFNTWFLREDTIETNRSQEFLALKVAVLNLRSVVDWMRSGHAGYTEYEWTRLISPGGELSAYFDSVRCNLKRLRMKILIRSL